MFRKCICCLSLVVFTGLANEMGTLSADEPAADEPKIEIVKERFPNGAIAVERHTTQDDKGNYINHGDWVAFYPDGKQLGGGAYVMGKRVGPWSRWFSDYDRDSLFSQPLYREYQGPFKSEAIFVAGELHGPWIIYDHNKQRISQWNFVKGAPHGAWTWYYPSGQKRREAHYVEGVQHGPVHEWAPDGKVILKVDYLGGRKKEQVVKYYGPGRKHWEGWYLRAKEVTRTSYEWWKGAAETSVVRVDGGDQRVGKWTWWFPNGQKQVEGVYAVGKSDLEWTWWHPNGQRWITGSYVLGRKSGVWKHWSPDGRLERTENLPVLNRPEAAPAVAGPPPAVKTDVPPAENPQPAKDPVPAPPGEKQDPGGVEATGSSDGVPAPASTPR